MKPYQSIPIEECGEPLVAIPVDAFARENPHPYVRLNAPYGGRSPYFLRQGVLDRLLLAHQELQRQRPGWRIQIFDAYRPISVQQFMVEHAFAALVREQGQPLEELTEGDRQQILTEVYQFWAVPSHDPATPPPHSTGAAIDVSLVNENQQPVNMGSPIDELSTRSYPDYFQERCPAVHQNRLLLREVMAQVGFCRHPNEWWHFSWGDQMWAWQQHETLMAQYGAVE